MSQPAPQSQYLPPVRAANQRQKLDETDAALRAMINSKRGLSTRTGQSNPVAPGAAAAPSSQGSQVSLVERIKAAQKTKTSAQESTQGNPPVPKRSNSVALAAAACARR